MQLVVGARHRSSSWIGPRQRQIERCRTDLVPTGGEDLELTLLRLGVQLLRLKDIQVRIENQIGNKT